MYPISYILGMYPWDPWDVAARPLRRYPPGAAARRCRARGLLPQHVRHARVHCAAQRRGRRRQRVQPPAATRRRRPASPARGGAALVLPRGRRARAAAARGRNWRRRVHGLARAARGRAAPSRLGALVTALRRALGGDGAPPRRVRRRIPLCAAGAAAARAAQLLACGSARLPSTCPYASKAAPWAHVLP
jgi:hypothetical protein